MQNARVCMSEDTVGGEGGSRAALKLSLRLKVSVYGASTFSESLLSAGWTFQVEFPSEKKITGLILTYSNRSYLSYSTSKV